MYNFEPKSTFDPLAKHRIRSKIRFSISLKVECQQKIIQFFKKPGRHLDRFTGKLIQSSDGEFWGVTQAVLLENSSKRKHLAKNNISLILGRHTGRFTGKFIQAIFQSFFLIFWIHRNKGRKNLYF